MLPAMSVVKGDIQQRGNHHAPSAPNTGSAARRMSDSSPCTISCLISMPTRKKKIAISASLIQACTGNCKPESCNSISQTW